jgi:hypothetical protein
MLLLSRTEGGYNLHRKLQGLAFRNVRPRPLGRTRAPSVLASGSREREPGIWHHRYQGFSTHASCRPALSGGKCRNTSPRRECSDGSSMESRWSSKRVFPLRRNLRRRNSSIHKMWILTSRIFSRTDASGGIKTLLREATSSSPDQGFTLLRARASSASSIVESAFFHVPIHPKHRKFFSSHLALPLFVKNKFIELQPGGYFVCSRPDLVSSVPSDQTPLYLRHLYHQVIEFSHATLSLGWTSSQDLDERHVRSNNSSSPSRITHDVVRRRLVDRLLLLRGSFKGATNNRGHTPRRGYSPRATQGLLRHSDPDCQRSPTGSREEVLCAASSNVRCCSRQPTIVVS